MTRIYAIRDILAAAIVGPLQTFKHDAVAVRFFSDVASQPGTSINQHIEQHELLCVGHLDDESGELFPADAKQPGPVVIITGAAWKAAQDAQENSK